MARLPDMLVEDGENQIVLLVMDGVGGLPHAETGRTELESARTPNLDRLAAQAALGLGQPVLPGITPGSGPGHLALFGYDPIEWNIGRGVLSALGVDFELQEGDVAARLNFASLDDEGRVTDRRAGRPPDDENRRLVAKLRDGIPAPSGVELFFEPEKEHRAVMILRGAGLSADLAATDPQETGVPPEPLRALSNKAGSTAEMVQRVLDDATAVLSDEPTANGLLSRGYAAYRTYPSLHDRFKLTARAIARYPMYRGVSRLIGMDIYPPPIESDEDSMAALAEDFSAYDLHFVHFKHTDSRGEDGDFDAKVAAIEAIDALIPQVEALEPDVLIVTGDHSTPARLRSHSWHPVPVLLRSPWARPAGVSTFGERACLRGELGVFPMKHLMTFALAHAGRLDKFGA